MNSTMQLEFAQAMSDFKTMFPDMDHDVIEAVLRANHGVVDATIDQLLAMSTDNQNEKLRNELEEVPTYSLINLTCPDLISNTINFPTTKNVQLIDTFDSISSHSTAKTNEILDNNLLIAPETSNHNKQAINTGASPKQKLTTTTITTNSLPLVTTTNKIHCSGFGGGGGGNGIVNNSRKWNPPILGPLPLGFLRLQQPRQQQQQQQQQQTHDVLGRDFDLPDEQFALMLQNEEFMNELRWNQDFMTALEKEQQGKSKPDDDAAFKERLKHMGKISRKKFLQMARVFTWQRNKKTTSAKQIDSLPLKEEPSDDEDHLRLRK